jgi:hypothetical protein
MPSCRVYIRGQRERIDASGDTIGHLRYAVAAFLTNDAAIRLPQAQKILIFGNDSATELNDASALLTTTNAKYTYTAFEVFTTVPTDLFRTVKLGEIHPAVDSDPGNQFTRVSPLFCAALTPPESEDPPFYMQGGRVLVRGASLRCGDTSVPATFGPADEAKATDQTDKLDRRMPLNDPVFQNTYGADTEFGILHTSVLNQTVVTTVDPLFVSKKISGGGPSKRNTRHYYWRYVIRRDTDLSSLGVSLIFDNASKDKNHFSLIPNQRSDLNNRRWGAFDPRQHYLWKPDPDEPTPPTDTMPETISVVYYVMVYYVAYPLVAQKFELHDFIMRASGLVQSIERYEDEDKQNAQQAAEIVFDRGDGLPNSYEIYEALDILSSFAFDVKKVPFYDLGILRYAMTESQDRDDVSDDERSVLSLAVKAIDTFFENCSEGSPRSVLPGLDDDDDTPRIEVVSMKDA